jgi:hypothetical protein
MKAETSKIIYSLATYFVQGPVVTAQTFKYVNQPEFIKWLKKNTHRFQPCTLDAINEFINSKN